MKYDFEHYLQAGHGRAYVIARADPERYRDRIMAACRNDCSFDMQSEGSRAFLTYDLISLYEDPTSFIEAIKESYKDPVADKDWNQICYLTDLCHVYKNPFIVNDIGAVEMLPKNTRQTGTDFYCKSSSRRRARQIQAVRRTPSERAPYF